MFAIMERIHATTVEVPVQIGDVILDDIFGAKIVAPSGSFDLSS